MTRRRPLRVCFVAPSLRVPGGQSIQAARLAEALRGLGLEVGFVPIDPRLPGPLAVLQRVRYIRTVVTELRYLAALLVALARYDIVHVFSASYFSFLLAPTPAILLGKWFGKRVLLNYRSGEAEDHLRRWRRSAIPVMRLADAVVVPSAYLVDVFARAGLEARAIPNMVDGNLFRFRARRPLRPVFLSNRSFEAHYNVACVLRAFALIQRQRRDARLIVAGDGPLRRSLLRLAHELDLRNVEFIGRVTPDHMPALLDATDVYLNAPDIDNMPGSVLEAFAAGLPVVTTDAGGIPYIVRHEATGLMVPRGDHEGLAAAALRLLADPGLAERLADTAHEECRRTYAPEAVLGEWHGLYEGLLASPATPTAVTGVRRTWKKLRGRTLAELRFRARQQLAKWSERLGWSDQTRVPEDRVFARIFGEGAALDGFRRRVTPHFFAAFGERDSVVAALRKRWPGAEGQVIAEAERLCHGEFDLLGHAGVRFGTPVDWHLDPTSGIRLPLEHWSRIDHANPEMAADVKLIWELNRHQYFVTLGKAYWYTGDERYAVTFLEHLSGWMDANPPKRGINWASSLEVAFRAIAWIWALYFFKDSPSLTEGVFRRAVKFLLLHGRHIETYLSTYYAPNTHLTGEALGLLYLGTVFPEFRHAQRWQHLGWSILVEQLGKQVRPDGSYFEQTTYYHRYTTDFCLHASILGRQNGLPVDAAMRPTLEGLLTHLMYVSQPDGRIPLVGDDDGGRLLFLDQRDRRDVRAALATGAVLCDRPDFRYVAGEAAEETAWLLGCAGLRAFDAMPSVPPADTSRGFRDGGYYVMRDHWGRDASTLLVDCGPHGGLGYAHAHADALSVNVTVRGVPVLVDPGSYTYRAAGGLRDVFRSSAAHNTVSVAGQSSSLPDGPFAWRQVARSTPTTWRHGERCDYFEGAHDGYARLTPPARHSRAVLFLRGDYWIVRDRVETEGAHDMLLHLTFAPGITLDVRSATRARASWGPAARRTGDGDSGALEIGVFGHAGAIRGGTGGVSHCYGAVTPASTAVFAARGCGPREVVSFLVPRSQPDERITIEERTAGSGRAFTVVRGLVEDEVLIGGGAGDLTSDAAWAWVRRPRGARSPSEFVVLQGRSLTWGGRPLLRADRPVRYLAARLQGSELFVEVDTDGRCDVDLLGADGLTVRGATTATVGALRAPALQEA